VSWDKGLAGANVSRAMTVCVSRGNAHPSCHFPSSFKPKGDPHPSEVSESFLSVLDPALGKYAAS